MRTGTITGANEVLRRIEKLTERRFLPIIGPVKGAYLAKVIKGHRVKRVLEVGTLIGYSAIMTASSLPPDGEVVSVEKDKESATVARANIENAGLSSKITVITGDALKVFPTLEGKFDLIFLDAAKGEYLEYLKLAERLLVPGGVVFADNAKIFAAEMSDYLGYVRNSGKYRSELVDFGEDGVEVSEKTAKK